MPKLTHKRNRSNTMKRLMRGLLILCAVLCTTIIAWYTTRHDTVDRLSQMVTIQPTPTPPSPAVARVSDMVIDQNGMVKGVWSSEDVPTLIVQTDVLYKNAVITGSGITNLLEFLTALDELDLAVHSASLYNVYYSEVVLDSGVTVLYSQERDPVDTAYKLQEMYAILSVGVELPQLIDMRFEKPVIVN